MSKALKMKKMLILVALCLLPLSGAWARETACECHPQVDAEHSTIQYIKRFEGFSATAYPDAGGYSIGHGHHMGTFPSVELEWISKREAHRLLVKDVLRVKRFVSRVVVVPLTRNQRDALVSFAFNVGMGAFEKSTLLKKVNSGDHVAAAAQFSRWTKIQGQRSKGLLRRRNCEQHIYMKEEVESIY